MADRATQPTALAPYILLSVPAGVVTDRYERRIILLITDVARGVLMVRKRPPLSRRRPF